MANNKKSTTFDINNNPTILAAMKRLTLIDTNEDGREYARINRLDEDALGYLCQRLDMDEMQVLVMTTAVYYCLVRSRGVFDCDDVRTTIGLHPFEALELHEVYATLDEMGYLEPRSMEDETWRITSKAMEAIKNNQKLEAQDQRLETNIDFLREASRIINNGSYFEADSNTGLLINRLMDKNPHLAIVRRLRKMNHENDCMAMVQIMVTMGIDEDDYVNARDMEHILSGGTVRRLLRQFQQEKHEFVTSHWIAPYMVSDMARGNMWVMTYEGWMEMLGNADEVAEVFHECNPSETLTSFTKFEKKPLYFSGKTKEQVERLSALLQEEQYAKVHDELVRRNMPRGFCCLLYGTPGTGKTELVQQLAIATGRDVMHVQLSGLRDKYVGETEKRIQAVFDSYRRAVVSSKRTPILFFNEADAIFGNRIENTTHSVDKMENTMQNIILEEMEKLDGIMICTTNLTKNLDKAFDRRFLFKIEFEKPNLEARQSIWKSVLDGLSDEQAAELANRYPFSGGQILNISRKQVINSIFTGTSDLDFAQILSDCSSENLSRTGGSTIGFA